jgi:catechol 2,3-dioxygenase-like lactoylglutathione lyase family enzyme
MVTGQPPGAPFGCKLVDHIQLVVADLAASRRFYEALFDVLDVPIGGSADSQFWFDELFVSTPDGPEAAGQAHRQPSPRLPG